MSTDAPARWPAAMSKAEASKYLSISQRSLERRIACGDIKLVRIGGGCYRIRRQDLDAYLDGLPYERGQRPGK